MLKAEWKTTETEAKDGFTLMKCDICGTSFMVPNDVASEVAAKKVCDLCATAAASSTTDNSTNDDTQNVIDKALGN